MGHVDTFCFFLSFCDSQGNGDQTRKIDEPENKKKWEQNKLLEMCTCYFYLFSFAGNRGNLLISIVECAVCD